VEYNSQIFEKGSSFEIMTVEVNFSNNDGAKRSESEENGFTLTVER